MRKNLILTIFTALLLCLTASPLTARATTFLSSEVYTEHVAEDPAELFTTPKRFYKGTGSNAGIEIWGEKTTSAKLPMDGDACKDLLFVNNSDKTVMIEQTGDVSLSGALKNYTEGQLIVFHPNPLKIILEPGETCRASLTVSFGNKLNSLTSNISGTLTIKTAFTVTLADGDARLDGDEIALSTPIKVNAYTAKYLSNSDNHTATIKGYVRTSAGKPIAGVTVTAAGGFSDSVTATTDSDGYYCMKVFGNKNAYTGKWHEYVLSFEKSGWADKKVVVYPKSNASITKSVTLKKSGTGLSYTLTGTIDLGVQAYSFDASSTGSIIAFIPFHSALSADTTAGKTNLTVVTKTGKLLFRTLLPGETPYVDVTSNGKYITTIEEYGNYSYPVIYDKSGNLVYKRETFPNQPDKCWIPIMFGQDERTISSKCSRLSEDGSLLYVGSCDGDFYCIDWQKDTILWAGFTRGQVRTIDFSKDNSLVYVSSGDGYFYCYTAAGEFNWKTYIGSWAVDVAVGADIIAVASKSDTAGIRVLDAQSGELKWCYPMCGRACTLVLSDDETLLWCGNDTCAATNAASSLVFNVATGKVKFALDPGAQAADWTSDGKYLAVKTATTLYVYNGKTGATLYEQTLVTGDGENAASINFSLYYSDNAKYIVAAFNNDPSERSWGQAYFFKKK